MVAENTLQAAVEAHVGGRIDEAEQLYEKVLKENPLNPIALHYVGVIYYTKRKFDAALASIEKSLAVGQNNSEAYANLGLVLVAKGRLDDAIEAYQRSIKFNPNNAESYNNLASALLDREDKLDEAIEAARKAVELKPTFAFAHYNLGVALQRKGQVEESIVSLQEAIHYAPDLPEPYCSLGMALMTMGKYDEAIEAYQHALVLRPDFSAALNNIGQPLCAQRRYEEASAAFRKALELQPEFQDAANNLITTLRLQCAWGEALEACEKAIALVPTNTKAQIELINLRRQTCAWETYESDSKKVIELIESIEPFLSLNTKATAAQQREVSQRWANKFPRGRAFVHDPSRSAGGRIRLGYISADFRNHATAYLVSELFERHDRSQFELYAYSYGFDDGSPERQRLIAAFDHFNDVRHLSADEAAQKIYDDKIDILVDLKGYTGDTRTEIIVDRPAPIQVNYLGFPGTMGADFIDYIIADSFVAPMEHKAFFSEKLVHIPYCYQPNDTKRKIAQIPLKRADFGLPEQGVIFCSFNGSYKLTPTFFDIWMRVLKATPGSVLWLLSSGALAEQNLKKEAVKKGIEPERIIFCSGLTLESHLARLRLADLSLDTLPVNAHTTASDSLWAGVPILTCVGEPFVGRVAGSLLQSVGLPELITYSLEEYEARAKELAANPAQLAAIREKLAKNVQKSPLFDIDRYTRDLEKAYREMVDTWRAGKSPKHIVIAS